MPEVISSPVLPTIHGSVTAAFLETAIVGAWPANSAFATTPCERSHHGDNLTRDYFASFKIPVTLVRQLTQPRLCPSCRGASCGSRLIIFRGRMLPCSCSDCT